jgi:hypothetical protein
VSGIISRMTGCFGGNEQSFADVAANGKVAPKADRCFGAHLYAGAYLDDLILERIPP